MNKNLNKKCEVCGKSMKAEMHIMGSQRNHNKISIQASEEGYCLNNKWFCKECHEEIMKYSMRYVDYKQMLKNL